MIQWRFRLVSLAVAVGLLGMGYAWAILAYGSFDGFRQRLSGRTLIVANPLVELGLTPQGEAKEFIFYVRNCANSPMTLLGMRKACGCITSNQFPLEIPARAWQTVAGKVHPTRSGRQVHYLEMYSDDSSSGRLPAVLTIVGEESTPSSQQSGG
jgi:hypothetical protein